MTSKQTSVKTDTFRWYIDFIIYVTVVEKAKTNIIRNFEINLISLEITAVAWIQNLKHIQIYIINSIKDWFSQYITKLTYFIF